MADTTANIVDDSNNIGHHDMGLNQRGLHQFMGGRRLIDWIVNELWRFLSFLGDIFLIFLEVVALVGGIIIAVDHNMVFGIIILVMLFYWMERTRRF